jgi:hypothetical protein
VLAFDNPGGTTAAHAIPFGHYDTATGCYVDIQSGVVKIVQNPGSVTASLGLTVPSGPGPNVLAIANTGGNFRAFLNGVGGSSAPVVVAVSGTYASPDTSAATFIGAGTSGASPWMGGVLHVKAYGRVLSDAELYAISANGQDNRYTLMTAPTGDTSLIFDAQPGRDWNGVSSTWTTRGSSPATLTNTGAPTLANVSECLAKRAAFLPGSYDTITSPVMPSAWGRTLLTTTDQVMYADYASGTITVILAHTYIDDVYSASQCGPDSCNPSVLTYASTRQVFPVTVGSGTSHTVEIDDGEAILTGLPPSAPGPPESQPLVAIRTSTCPIAQVTTPPANGHVVFLGDSICVGAVANPLGRDGWLTLLRDAYRSKGVGVSAFCQSGNSLTENANLFYGSTPASLQSMANDLTALVQKVQAGGQKWVVIELGENDLGLTNPSFGSQYQTLMADIHSNDSAIHVLADTPAYSCSQESAAVTLRGVINTAVLNANSAAGVSFATFLDNTSTVSVGNVTQCPHYNNAGHAQMEAKLCATLPFGC